MEEKRVKGFSGWWIALALAVGLAAGYFIGTHRERPFREGAVTQKIAPEPQPPPSTPVTGSAPETATAGRLSAADPYKGLSREEMCSKVEKDVADFFDYVSGKDYFKHLAGDSNAFERFRKVLERLSARPPIPGGEGVDSAVVINNIYYLFRTLQKEDLRIIKEFLANEGEGLELDLSLLYKWLMLEEACGKDKTLRPSFDLLYQMAGFFLNTIGGRAYLARRPASVRALVTYYCVLILHEANKRGRNSYGIDILPQVALLKDELASTKAFKLEDEYLRELASIERHYSHRK
jgi:hypothetical protein